MSSSRLTKVLMESARSLEDARTRAEALAVLLQTLSVETGLSTWRSLVTDAAALDAEAEAAVLDRLMVNPPDDAPIATTVHAFCSRTTSASNRLRVIASASVWRPETVARIVQSQLSESPSSVEQFALIMCSEVRSMRKHRRRKLLTAARGLDNFAYRASSALHLLSGTEDPAFVRWARIVGEETGDQVLRRAIHVAIDYSLSDPEFIESIEHRLLTALDVSDPEERIKDLLNCVGDLRLSADVLARAEIAIVDAISELNETYVQLHYLNEFAMAMIGAAVGDFRVALSCVMSMASEKHRANGLCSILVAYSGSSMEHAVKDAVESIGDPAARARLLSMFYKDEALVFEEEVLSLLDSADDPGSVVDQCLHLIQGPAPRDVVVDIAVSRVDEIQSPWRKFRALEALLSAGADQHREQLLDLARATVGEIPDQHQRDRAGARMIRHLPCNERAARLTGIVNCILTGSNSRLIPQRLELTAHESGLGWIEGL